MCGRFIVIPKDELQRIILDVKTNLEKQKAANVSAAHQEAYPESLVPVVLARQNRLEVETMSWGFPKTWGDKRVVFNTRDDSATDSTKKFNMWREPLAQHRCIVPTYGFYEPHKSETRISEKSGKPIKQQYLFHLPDSPVVMLAGVYEVLPDGNSPVGHFAVMTTQPNRWMADVHPRMPVVLLPHEVEQWLSDDYLPLLNRSSIKLVKAKAA